MADLGETEEDDEDANEGWQEKGRDGFFAWVFDGLSHPARVRMVELFTRDDEVEVSAKDMAEAADMKLQSAMYHVRYLEDKGLIKLARKQQVRGAVRHLFKMGHAMRGLLREMLPVLDEHFERDASAAE